MVVKSRLPPFLLDMLRKIRILIASGLQFTWAKFVSTRPLFLKGNQKDVARNSDNFVSGQFVVEGMTWSTLDKISARGSYSPNSNVIGGNNQLANLAVAPIRSVQNAGSCPTSSSSRMCCSHPPSTSPGPRNNGHVLGSTDLFAESNN